MRQFRGGLTILTIDHLIFPFSRLFQRGKRNVFNTCMYGPLCKPQLFLGKYRDGLSIPLLFRSREGLAAAVPQKPYLSPAIGRPRPMLPPRCAGWLLGARRAPHVCGAP
jgi:hypothetical protein